MTRLFLELAGRLPVLSHCHQAHRERLAADALLRLGSVCIGCQVSKQTPSAVCVRKACGDAGVGQGVWFVDSEPWNAKLRFVDRPQGRCRQVASKTRFPPETRALPPQQTDEGRAGRDKLGCFPCDAPRPVHESEDAVNQKQDLQISRAAK